MNQETLGKNIVSYYKSNLETYLLSVESELSVSIPRWDWFEDYHWPGGSQHTVIELLPAGWDYDYGDELAPTREYMVNYAFDIMITQNGSKSEDVQRVLQRYIKAIAEMTIADDTYNSIVVWARLGSGANDDMLQSQRENLFQQTVLQRLLCRATS